MIRKAFLSGEFERMLRRLNPDLRIYCGDDATRPAGLCLVRDGRIVKGLGAVDKGFIPAGSIVGETGTVIKKGWMAVIKALLAQRHIREADVRRLLPEYYDCRGELKWTAPKSEVDEAVDYFKDKRPLSRNGNPVYTRNDLMEIGDAFNGK